MRIIGWEKRLNAVVAKHQLLPSQWGISDCYTLPDDCVEAVTGSRMYAKARGYKTEAGAAKVLRRHGFVNVAEAFAAKFEPVSILQAGRGDIGVIERNGTLSGGFFTSTGFVTRSHGGPVEILPMRLVTQSFRVI